MEQNDYYIKIMGKCNIPKSLVLGHNYNVTMDCSITAENRIDNEDGRFDIVYKVEPITATIQKDNGEVVKAKDPRKNSVKIRNYLHRIWSDRNVAVDFEEVYTKVTNKILLQLPELFEEVIKN